MIEKDLFVEVVRLVEAGMNKFLNRSILYSPFRLFFNLFKRHNPRTMDSIREMVRNDVEQVLGNIENFNQVIFVASNGWTMSGKDFLRSCYNIGINILRKKVTMMMAFKAFRDYELRNEIYNYILEEVRLSAMKAMKGALKEIKK
jgi:hypothetical protein